MTNRLHVITVSVAGRGGASTEYYYGRGGREMKPDRTVSGGRSYDGEAEQRDSRRRSVQYRTSFANVRYSLLPPCPCSPMVKPLGRHVQ